jgi:hypothetical protein
MLERVIQDKLDLELQRLREKQKQGTEEVTLKNQLATDLAEKTAEITEMKESYLKLAEEHDKVKSQLTKDDIEIK